MARIKSDERFKDAGLMWIDQGGALLPIQPRSKRLVAGYGPYRKSITERLEILEWWSGRQSYPNMAVLGGPDHGGIFILDFDLISVYDQWKQSANGLQNTYHEFTPNNGRHVFFRVGLGWPVGVDLVKGVELKTVCIVAPSIHPNGGEYQAINPGSEIISLDDWRSPLFSLSVSGRIDLQQWEKGRDVLPNMESSLVGRVKTEWEILTYFGKFLPDVGLKGRGRWRSGRCPLPDHEDKHPSFAVNIDTGFWVCHGCQRKGDVINLHMYLYGLTLREALFDLLDGGWRRCKR
jgi:hypothetical protein